MAHVQILSLLQSRTNAEYAFAYLLPTDTLQSCCRYASSPSAGRTFSESAIFEDFQQLHSVPVTPASVFTGEDLPGSPEG